MSFPVDPTPEQHESAPAPVWDRLGAKWYWDRDVKDYVCEDPEYTGPPVANPGAIPAERQPHFAHPPTDVEQVLADEEGPL